MIEGAIQKIRKEHPFLSQLDSASGDGDHGTTMLRAVNQVEKAMAERPSQDLQGLLGNVAWTLLGIDGGATGPLLGSWFTGMSESVAGKQSLNAEAFSVMFEGGLKALKEQTKAQVGDRSAFARRQGTSTCRSRSPGRKCCRRRCSRRASS